MNKGRKSDLFYCPRCKTDKVIEFKLDNKIPYCKNCSDTSNFINIKLSLLNYK